MAFLAKKLSDSVARSVPAPEVGEVLWWCPETPGLGLRVSSTGVKSYIMERHINGKNKRRTIGRAVGKAAISCETARKLQITLSSELQSGVDRVEVAKVARKIEAVESVTLGDAVKTYIKGKRRAKDGLPLSVRTADNYTKMITKGGVHKKTGEPFLDGYLCPLSEKPLHKITGQQIRDLYKNIQTTRGQRGAEQTMQLLRAVLNWHGVHIPDSPLDRATAGRDRIILPQAAGNPTPIPFERLGAWWRTASAMAGNPSADGLRYTLLTGCRPGAEVFGNQLEPEGLRVGDVDLEAGCVYLGETKNRASHTIYLSTQALDILKVHCKGKKPKAKVFDVIDTGALLEGINERAGVHGITPHKLRHTFASIADDLVSANAVKKMMNHSTMGDVTATHYIGKSENQLKKAWQTVADFIENEAKSVRV